jgi:anti-sigma factor RsiW
MNCRGWHSHIALYVEGDLERDLTRDLESHLTVCDECRVFVEELRESQVGVRQLRSEIVEASSLNRVRANVLDQVRAIQERRTWLDRISILLWGGFRWRYAVLGSVALLAVSIMVWRLTLKQSTVAPVVPQVAVIAPAPLAATAEAETPKPTPIKRTVTARKRLKTAAPAEPAAVAVIDKPKPPDTVMKILTDDPNVVIYWLIEQTGGM